MCVLLKKVNSGKYNVPRKRIFFEKNESLIPFKKNLNLGILSVCNYTANICIMQKK